MTSLGVDLRSDPEDLAAAADVARRTMRRARENVGVLVELLPSIGYEFETVPFVPASASAGDELDSLEETIGTLPLSLRMWFEEVGHVNFMGRHPAWDFDLLDQLVVEAPVDYIRSEFEAWDEDRGTEFERGSMFEVPIAPDYLHKADISGGSPYGLAVPNPGADGLLLWEPHQTTFVNYLRLAFSAGGMPGWQMGHLVPDWAAPENSPPAELIEVARQLRSL
jgi:hypothetical protein